MEIVDEIPSDSGIGGGGIDGVEVSSGGRGESNMGTGWVEIPVEVKPNLLLLLFSAVWEVDS